MTSKFSILSAAFAIGTLAALPALAETAAPATPASPAPAASSAVQSGVHTDAKAQPTDEHKAKDKASQDKKAREQLAEHPAVPGKSDSTVKTDSAGKPLAVKPTVAKPDSMTKDAGSK